MLHMSDWPALPSASSKDFELVNSLVAGFYLPLDGSEPMQGDLDMGGYSIILSSLTSDILGNWDGTVPVDLSSTYDAGATTGFAFDSSAGAAQLMGDVWVGGDLTLIGSGTVAGTGWSLAEAGVLTLGSSNDVLIGSAADGTYRLWVGHATAGSAPFRVTKAGAVTATNATLTGTITATAGSFGVYTIGSYGGEAGLIDTTRSGTTNKIGMYGSAIEVGWTTSGGPGTASIDFHTGDDVNYNARINVTGGSSGLGGGTMTIDANLLYLPRVQVTRPTGGPHQFQSADGYENFINFRRGGSPSKDAGIILSHFSADHWFVYNNGGTLSFRYTTENTDTPSAAYSGTNYLTLTTSALTFNGSTVLHTGNHASAVATAHTHTTAEHAGMSHTGHYAGLTASAANLRYYTNALYYWNSSRFAIKDRIRPVLASDSLPDLIPRHKRRKHDGWENPVLDLIPARFDSIPDRKAGRTLPYVGFVAEQVEQVFPEAASYHTDEDGQPVLDGWDTDIVVAALVAKVKEQDAIIREQENRLTQLEETAA